MMLQDLVYTQLQNALAAIGAAPDTLAPFEIPRQQGFGHLSTTVAMSLARELRKPPRAIAQELINHMGQIPMVDKIEIAGAGFINVTFAPAAFHAVLQDLEKKGDDIGRSAIGKGLKVNVEYVSANPTGPLHAGHGRNCALGDTIANVLEWTGHEVTREYYFNNAGNQMNKLGLSIAARVCDLLGRAEVLPFPEDGYHGEYIVTIAELLLSTEKTELEQLVEQSDLETLQTRCRKAGEQWCFEHIKNTLTSLNIKHDVYFNEDSLYQHDDGKQSRVERTIANLRERGLVYDKDGAVWFALSLLQRDNEKVERQDKVIVKSSGEPTYRLPDIAYHVEKLERGFDKLVDIFGADHIATIPDVLSGVEALGYNANKVKVVIHQMVTFVEDGNVVKFSKRSGKSFTLDDLIDEVGADVVRFFFVMRSPGTHLDFDLGLAKEEGEKNPVFYLQYAHARICSILRKVGGGVQNSTSVNISVLSHPCEIELIAVLSRFQSVLERSAENLEPHIVTEYLRDLASAYHQFYHDCRIIGSEEGLQSARLILANVTRQAMYNGLRVLGVAAPESM